jgi:hypothetical protein
LAKERASCSGDGLLYNSGKGEAFRPLFSLCPRDDAGGGCYGKRYPVRLKKSRKWREIARWLISRPGFLCFTHKKWFSAYICVYRERKDGFSKGKKIMKIHPRVLCVC